MSDSLTELKLNQPSRSPGYLKGYADFHKYHREVASLSVVREAGYNPPAGEETEYAAGWKQASIEREQANEATQTAGIIGMMGGPAS